MECAGVLVADVGLGVVHVDALAVQQHITVHQSRLDPATEHLHIVPVILGHVGAHQLIVISHIECQVIIIIFDAISGGERRDGQSGFAHIQGIRAVILVFEGRQYVLQLVKGFRDVHAHRVQPIAADQQAALRQRLIVYHIDGQLLAVLGGDVLLLLGIGMHQIPVVRHIVIDQVGDIHDHAILIGTHNAGGIVLNHTGNDVRIISGCYHQVELRFHGKHVHLSPVHRYAQMLFSLLENLKL